MDFLAQLQSIAAAQLPAKSPRFNPRPPGVIREGSASDAVLKFMRESPGMKSEAAIRWATGRSHSAVSWALMYLARQGLIESRLDPVRNSRYRKYRLKPQEQDK